MQIFLEAEVAVKYGETAAGQIAATMTSADILLGKAAQPGVGGAHGKQPGMEGAATTACNLGAVYSSEAGLAHKLSVISSVVFLAGNP